MNRSLSRRGAFSLLEILVVIAIAAVIGSLALGGFSSFQGSQRRTNCQSNLVQIYRAARLYANDNDGYPPTYAGPTPPQLSGGLGLLWAQYDSGGTGLKRGEDVTSYLKTPNALHCPADTGTGVPQSPFNAAGQVDPGFLSYQKVDPQGGDDSDPNIAALDKNQSYLPVRTTVTSDLDYARQLRHRDPTPTNPNKTINIPTPSSTVMTWCPFHRGAGASISSGKPDNVLFFDGSVRRMEITQDTSNCVPSRALSSGWRRVSECTASTAPNNEGASLAQP